ncbi:hypothetical protein [Neosynechococcus sphagnicola]|uniref:hypothetical protein n=1 Tax=Neosynechococcus sphagnicola TaxID=1501145 RepID=UPI000AB1521C|nr:hypothetical protein [Neosynechococcus sphagnicola]
MSFLQRVGVIGGGQLAGMMAAIAPSLGIELVVQTPDASDPAVAGASHTILAAIADREATAALATYCEVITFENEFIDLEALSALAAHGGLLSPQSHSPGPPS